MAHPQAPAAHREAVRRAFLALREEESGRAVLAEAARKLGLEKPRGFVAATDADYENYRRFFRETRVPLKGQ